ncbi:MAG TPA: hypothetical protein PLX79_04140 [Candidatus Dojkabacteria bacterium]|nr:hypothetical protein [Candidatus Dojkabacteria bacterium]
MNPLIITVKLNGYDILQKLDYLALGKIVDKEIETRIPDGKYILRAIGSQDHPGMNIDQLVKIIVKLGTDKYDPNRKGVCHDDFANYDYDIQAGTCEIKNSKLIIDPSSTIPSEFGDIILHFCEHVIHDRGYPVKIDVLMFYDPSQLSIARKINKDSKSVDDKLVKYLYKFNNSQKKHLALKAVVKII